MQLLPKTFLIQLLEDKWCI